VVREHFDLDLDAHLDLGRDEEEGSLVLDEHDLNRDDDVDAWRRYGSGERAQVLPRSL